MSKRNTKGNAGLGRQLIKNKKTIERKKKEEITDRHTTDWEPTKESILDQSDLGEIMDYATLSGKQFHAVKQNAVIITNNAFNVETITDQQIEGMKRHWNDVTIPKRPPWNENQTKAELDKQEKEYFLTWRRGLAKLEEEDHLLLTPYEKNIEVWRQLWRVVERSSLIVQIVDARNPLLFRCIDLENWVSTFNPKKRNLLLVNKADFLNDKQRQMWADYFNSQNVNFIFFSAKQSDEQLNDSSIPDSVLPEINTTKVYSRLDLLNRFIFECNQLQSNEKTENESVEFKHTVGMVGYPNVGKSSTINVLLEKKAVAVSKTPGKTKHLQTAIIPDKPIILCDCPGLVFPSFITTRSEMVCNGLLRIAELRDVMGPARIVCKNIPRSILQETYSVLLPSSKPEEPVSPEQLLNSFGYVRGFMGAHGQPDIFRAGKVILNDYVAGKLLYCNPPPDVPEHEFNAKENISPPPPKTAELISNESVAFLYSNDTSNSNEVAVVNETETETTPPVDEPEDDDIDISILNNDEDETRNPNDRSRLARGKKQQRREKQKQQLQNQSGAYVTGKRHANLTGAVRQYGVINTLPATVRLSNAKRTK